MGDRTRRRIVGSRLDGGAQTASGDDGRLLRQHRPMLAWLAGTGLALAAVGLPMRPAWGLPLLQLGLFMAVHAGVIALSLLPPSALGQRADAFLERWVKDPSAGFYGMMALATFVQLEVRMFLREVAEFELGGGLVLQALLRWLLGFSVESFVNMLWAMAWPVRLLSAASPSVVAATVALAWLVHWQVGRRLPAPGRASAMRADE